MPNSVLVFCLFRSIVDIDQVQNALSSSADLSVVRCHLKGNTLNPFHFLAQLPHQPRKIIFAVYEGNLKEELSACAGFANLQRERLNTASHPLVMWFQEEAFSGFIKQAPDFWA